MARATLLIVAAALGLCGAWIPIKAQLAQVLIRRAWDAREGGVAPRPWPWADTQPVGELAHGDDRWIVLAGATGRTLAFGPGHVDGTARPGERGRVAIAGHRDTHFRFLQDLKLGDHLELTGPDGRVRLYAVRDTRVAHERETAFLHGADGLVLITCYPFNALAPGGAERYVVLAELLRSRGWPRPERLGKNEGMSWSRSAAERPAGTGTARVQVPHLRHLESLKAEQPASTRQGAGASPGSRRTSAGSTAGGAARSRCRRVFGSAGSRAAPDHVPGRSRRHSRPKPPVTQTDVFDNMKTAVLERHRNRARPQSNLVAFAAHYGFAITAYSSHRNSLSGSLAS